MFTVLLTTPEGVPAIQEVPTEWDAFALVDDMFDALAMAGSDIESHASFQLWAVDPDGQLIYHTGLNDGFELTGGA